MHRKSVRGGVAALLLSFALLAAAPPVRAAAPEAKFPVTFTTTLASGALLPFTFTLWDARTGGTQVAGWVEGPVKLRVASDKTVYFVLGSKVPLPALDFTQQYWVEIATGLKKYRTRLPAAAYAQWSEGVNTDPLDARYVEAGEPGAVTGDMIADGQVTAAKISPEAAAAATVLTSNGDGTAAWQPVAGATGGDVTGVVAGSGLTHGGTEGEVTLNVGSGTGIVVDADAVSLDTPWTDARYVNEGQTGAIAGAMLENGAVTDAKITGPIAGAKLGSHQHAGADVASGTLAEARVDPAIARDAEIVPAVLATDGAGSGLDADLLDGQHGAAFAPAGHAHDASYYSKAEVDALVAGLQAQVAALQSLLQHFSRSGDDISITGANLWIKSGAGATSGTLNGLGNLIVGYNALRGSGDDRSGSHNIVVGDKQNYSSFGGLVAGVQNTVSGRYASVTGGYLNTASGDRSFVAAGNFNSATGIYSSVSGGSDNSAIGAWSSVSGGDHNAATAMASSISGGTRNRANGDYSSVSGGYYSTASGNFASVSGGAVNAASGAWSAVSGGAYNEASGTGAVVAGGGDVADNGSLGNKAIGDFATVVGGVKNVAGDKAAAPDRAVGKHSAILGGATNNTRGQDAIVSGGEGNVASGQAASVSGGGVNTASGYSSSVSGGVNSTASGEYSSVSGGNGNQASGHQSSVSGGDFNTAAGFFSSVSGGSGNASSGDYCSVSGGIKNTASGQNASVSGGANNRAVGNFASVAGGGDVSNAALGNKAVGEYSAVVGGVGNVAGDTAATPDASIGKYSAILGGSANNTRGWRSTVSGGDTNTASGSQGAVAGGYLNNASGWSAAVGGGRSNTASGDTASVSGGASKTQGAVNGWTGGNWSTP